MDLERACAALAGRFYDSVLTEEPAAPLLDEITALLGFEVGSIVSVRHAQRAEEARCVSASGIDIDACRRAESQHKVSAGRLLRDGSPMQPGRLQHRDTLVDLDLLRRQPYFQEFVVPNRIEEGAKMLLYRGQDQSIFVNFARPRSHAGEGQREQVLRLMAPHMVRSTLIHVKLEQAESLRRLCWESANLCPYPMVVLDNQGQVFLANELAETVLSGDGLSLRRTGFRADLAPENQRLQHAVHEVIAASEGVGRTPCPNALLVSRPSGKRPYSLVLMPLSPERQTMGRRPAAVALVFDPEASQTASVSRCREVFGLTRAEAEVAIGVMQGQSPEQIAATQDRSPTTVRNLLKRVFQKTDVNRQNELAHLMLSSPVVGPGLPGLSRANWDPYRDSDTA